MGETDASERAPERAPSAMAEEAQGAMRAGGAMRRASWVALWAMAQASLGTAYAQSPPPVAGAPGPAPTPAAPPMQAPFPTPAPAAPRPLPPSVPRVYQPRPAAEFRRPEIRPFVPPPPLRFHTELRSRWSFVAAGAAIFGGIWLATAFVGLVSGKGVLAIPIAGPFFTLDSSDYSDKRMANVGLATVASLQLAGVLLFGLGLGLKRPVLVPDGLTFAPLLLPGGAGGLAVGGRF